MSKYVWIGIGGVAGLVVIFAASLYFNNYLLARIFGF